MKKALVILAALGSLISTSRGVLVAHYKFDGDFNDSSGMGNNGTAMNGASLGSDVPPGFGGQSLSLGDGGQHVLVPHSTTLDISDSMTIAAWVKPMGVAWEGILAKNPSEGSGDNHAGNYELRIENGTNQLNFLYQQGGANDTAFPFSDAPAAVIGANAWIHIAVTAEQIGDAPGEVKYYTNGVLADTKPLSAGFGATNTNPLYIGSRADLFTQFNGYIDDLRIYNHVLSEAEIANIPEPSTGLLASLGILLLVGSRRRR